MYVCITWDSDVDVASRLCFTAAGLEDGQTVPDVLDDGADAYIPGIVRRYDREFQVDFTNK